MRRTNWSAYLDDFHRKHPAITERALHHARHPRLGTAYEWLAAASPGDAGDVVDLACGSCPVQQHMRYRSYVGIDRSEAELHAAHTTGRGPVVLGDVTDTPVAPGSADTVVMSMALMLVPLAPTLAEVRRILRPGGRFVAIVPAMQPLLLRDLLTAGLLSALLDGPGSMPHHLHASPLRHALTRAGLRPVRATRARFPFPMNTPADAHLAVESLYTPGRSSAQLRRASSVLQRLPAGLDLPVPLLRVTAVRAAA